ncbi:MAG TPA: helix-turn-helix transcriptional regulator [Pseudolabrys sp.]|jgi:XRE family aerobic/anaerobic benzoate catabolism transcriptional regulator|nr:helix-turn-helix transcriptional regulator [Pseudolabrys sp.]
MAVKTARKVKSAPRDSYLDRLGERVRRLRNQRGMTRKALAQHAEISERYIAQLESGEGNCSIVLLRRIARAIGVQLPQLVSEGADPPLDAVLFTQFVERLPAPALKEAREMVMRRFADLTTSSRRSRIALLGMRGSGKSTLGARLAKERGVPFIELDREIERTTGTSLTEIFQLFGQETFRRAEREALDRVLSEHKEFVMATSGSIVTEPGTLDVLLSSCFTIWVKAEPDVHMARVVAQGDLRPMSANPRAMDDLVSILNSREPLYAKADATLDTNGRSIDASLTDLAALTASQTGL